jgi:hypothetical protein
MPPQMQYAIARANDCRNILLPLAPIRLLQSSISRQLSSLLAPYNS